MIRGVFFTPYRDYREIHVPAGLLGLPLLQNEIRSKEEGISTRLLYEKRKFSF